MKAGVPHFIIALIMFGYAIYTLVVFDDICDIVMSCSVGLFNTILGATCIIIEKIDSHENKITKKTSERSEKEN